MNANETIIGLALIFHASDDDFAEAFHRLSKFDPESKTLSMLIDSHFRAVLSNTKDPDVIGEFLKAGGTFDEYSSITESVTDFIITPSGVNGAITR